MSIGEKITMQRKIRGMSQEALANEMDVTRQAVSRWESGDTTPSVDKLKALAKLYGVSLDWLFGDTADGEPPEAAKPEADLGECRKLVAVARMVGADLAQRPFAASGDDVA